MWRIFARLIAFWQGEKPQGAEGMGARLWHRGAGRTPYDAADETGRRHRQESRLLEGMASHPTGQEDEMRHRLGAFHQPAREEKEASTGSAFFRLPEQERRAAAPFFWQEKEMTDARARIWAQAEAKTAEQRGETAIAPDAAGNAREGTQRQEALPWALPRQEKAAAAPRQVRSVFSFEVTEPIPAQRAKRRLIPYGEKREGKNALQDAAAADMPHRSEAMAAEGRMEQTINIDDLMRRLAQRLWEEREGSSRKRYG